MLLSVLVLLLLPLLLQQLHCRGLPQQLGIPLQQHLWLCASAVLSQLLEVVLPGVSSSSILQLLDVVSDTPLWAKPKHKGRQPEDCYLDQQWLETAAQVVLQLCPLLQGPSGQEGELHPEGEAACEEGVLRCMLHLSWLWEEWMSVGKATLVIPKDGQLVVLPVGDSVEVAREEQVGARAPAWVIHSRGCVVSVPDS